MESVGSGNYPVILGESTQDGAGEKGRDFLDVFSRGHDPTQECHLPSYMSQ